MKNVKIQIIIFGIFLLLVFFYARYFYRSNTTIFTNPKSPPKATARKTDPYKKNLDGLLSIVNKQDPYAALQELQHGMDADPFVFKNCHTLAHEIGHEAFKKYQDFSTALKYQDITCSDGYLHGVIEQAFAKQYTDAPTLLKKVQKLCDNLKGQTDRCYHGVGHAMMYYTSNDLPKSLALCENYSGIPRRRCYEGVFMENFLSDPDLHPSKYVNFTNPFYPCPEEKTQYKLYCYFYAPILFLHLNNDDYAKALEWCETDKSGYASECIKGVGSLIVKYNIKDPGFGEKLCAASKDVKDCIAGMVSYALTFYGNSQRVLQMCNQMDADHKNMCIGDLNKTVHLF